MSGLLQVCDASPRYIEQHSEALAELAKPCSRSSSLCFQNLA